jgi:hypothetical protein
MQLMDGFSRPYVDVGREEESKASRSAGHKIPGTEIEMLHNTPNRSRQVLSA